MGAIDDLRRPKTGRPLSGCGLAHAGQREEFLHALLRRTRGAASGDAEREAGGADRPQRSRRPAFRPVPMRRADILGQTSVQATGRDHLRELLNRASGGVDVLNYTNYLSAHEFTGSFFLRFRSLF